MTKEQFFTLIQEYAIIVWENSYTKGLIFYVIYIVLVFFVISPIFKKLVNSLLKKTKSNLDDKLYHGNKKYFRILFLLIGFIIVYQLYFKTFVNPLYNILYNIAFTCIYIIAYLTIHKTANIFLKFLLVRYPGIITKNLANLIKIVLSVFIISIILLLTLNVWGVNITPLLASAGIFGIAVAMASKNIIENFLSGLIMFADKNINISDIVVLNDGTSCVVQEINVRTTILKTFDGDIVILPNTEFLNQKVVNKSLSVVSERKRVSVTIGISYGDDSEKAKELLISYMKELEGVDLNSIVAFVDNLSDWSVNITSRAMIEADSRSYLMPHQITEMAYKDFPKHGLTFPFPTYTVDSIAPGIAPIVK